MGVTALIPESSTQNIEILWTNSTNVPLLSLLREFRYRKSKDPRDKIFALLNVAAGFGNSVPFAIDYAVDLSDLFQQVAIWVPDWSLDGDMNDQQKFAGSSSAVLFYNASDIHYNTDRMQICSEESSNSNIQHTAGERRGFPAIF
ncbi:hypothetical protein B0J14DRAFT_564674 [Halenospora varia]|nr:hypothetical protein B0J14DRAFT_564674 [Halenospora varia]